MSNATVIAVLADLEQRLRAEGQPIPDHSGNDFYRGLEAGYRDAARMVREALATSA